MELGNRNHPIRYKQDLYPPTIHSIDREERLATVWMAYVQDAGYSLNSYWSQSMDLRELLCRLPTSNQDFCREVRAPITGLNM
jgi:hypothetical protein